MNNKSIKPYFLVDQEGTVKIYETIDKVKIMLDKQDIISCGGLSQKQLDLYLFRHPEYTTMKQQKKTFVSVDILGYLLENIERKRKKSK